MASIGEDSRHPNALLEKRVLYVTYVGYATMWIEPRINPIAPGGLLDSIPSTRLMKSIRNEP